MADDFRKLLHSFFRYSGAEYLWQKFYPSERDHLPSGLPWLIGIYIACFGLATQRFETRLDIIEARTSSLLTLMGTSSKSVALSQFAKVQKMTCPVRPSLIWPPQTWQTLFGEMEEHEETITSIKDIIVAMKTELNKVDLVGIDLSNSDLRNANFVNSNLSEADLSGADLRGANLSGANLSGSKVSNTDLRGSILHNIQGLTVDDLKRARTDMATSFPQTTEIPENVESNGLFQWFERRHPSGVTKVGFHGNTRHYLKILRPFEGDFWEVIITLDGEEVEDGLLYFDENVWGSFLTLSVRKSHIVNIKGLGVQEEYYRGFSWGLEYETGGYHSIDWNYADSKVDGKYEYQGLLGSEVLEDISEDDLYPDYDLLSDGPEGIVLGFRRRPGNYIGIELFTDDDTVTREECLDYYQTLIMKYSDASPETVTRICENGAFVLIDVPDFRKDDIIKVFNDEENLTVVTMDKIYPAD